ncbi:helix-turn-helix domain-containing protein [Neobacillus sp. YIM B06451]|uniref:helix-turn-helix domain-containing protein n=1 Tax=Neobacillus sp. YIM B06451 TaxID=3070994 RepID=UPI00292E011C|nr:helix-turn-helix domain-containing protein [Neobacillus sp. YIM B06451]
MDFDRTKLILHPVRMKIVQSLVNGRHRTAFEIMNHLKEVPQATLYRHLNKLQEAGLIEVVQENPVRGTVEKVYALKQTFHTQLGTISKDQHLELFFTFLAQLMGTYEHYLSTDFDLVRDGVSYRVARMHLTDEEFMELAQNIRRLINEAMENEPSDERMPRNLATIVIPEKN